MPSDQEQLVVQLEARIRDFEKNMQKAEGTGTRSFTNLRKSSASATKAMEDDMVRSTTRINQAMATTSGKIGQFGKAFSVGLAAGTIAAGIALLAIRGLMTKTKQAMDDLGDLNDRSTRSGLDPETFQAIALQAKLASVDVNTLSGALETFNKNSGLAVVAKGKMVQALKALNPALLENIRNATSQAERVKLAADAIDQAKTSSEKAALSTAMFGANMVAALDGGSAALDQTAAKARELGIIIDNQTVAAADDLGDRFDTATTILDTQFKIALINLAPTMVTTAELVAKIAGAINMVIDSLRDFQNQSDATLAREQGTIGLKRLDLQNQIMFEKDSPTGNAEIIKDLEAQDAELAKQDAQITDLLNKRNKAAAAGVNNGTGGKPPLLPPIPDAPSSSRNDAAKKAMEQAKAITDLIDNLKLEQSQVGMTNEEIAESNALHQAGAAATEEQRKQIEDIIHATYAEKAAHEALTETLQLEKDTVGGALSDMRSALEDGKISWDEWKDVATNALNKVVDKLQDMLLDQVFTKGGFNILTLFGGVTPSVGGGVAGAPAAAAPSVSQAPAAAPGQQHVHITVGLKKNGLNIEPEVTDIARSESGKAAKVTLAATRAAHDKYRRNELPNDIKRFTQHPRERGRRS